MSIQPDAPRADFMDSRKFTDGDKIFFIHFLRWFLRKGPVPRREALYVVLEEQVGSSVLLVVYCSSHSLRLQTPHHNAESWKRHWNDYPELPDKIYIEARKRADYEAFAGDVFPSSSTTREGHGEDTASGEQVLSMPESTSRPASGPAVNVRRPIRPKGGIPVTDNDFREMARYMYEKRHVWHEYPTVKSRWEEFGHRPKVSPRPAHGTILV